MATVASIAIRRANAEAAIKDAVSVLADKHGIKIEDQSYSVRDVELRRVIDLEATASQLGEIVKALAPKKEAAKNEPNLKAADEAAK